MSVITPDILKQVAMLARLRVEGQASAELSGQLGTILDYVRQLQQVPTAGVEPTSHVLSLSNVLREDRRRPSLDPKAVTAIAPVAHQSFVAVPKVIDA
ncbi:MAG TPA: Asp-tRNA(Asn)/Glu-tRNA(Gln) amidotransferase subunit GatC [bacterium]